MLNNLRRAWQNLGYGGQADHSSPRLPKIWDTPTTRERNGEPFHSFERQLFLEDRTPFEISGVLYLT